MSLVRIVAIPAAIGAGAKLFGSLDDGTGAERAFGLDAPRLIKDREAVAVLIGIAEDQRRRGAIARLARARIAEIGHARVGVLGRALDSRAGLTAPPAAYLDTALTHGAEILVQALLIVMAAEGAIELAAIA